MTGSSWDEREGVTGSQAPEVLTARTSDSEGSRRALLSAASSETPGSAAVASAATCQLVSNSQSRHKTAM